MKDLIVKCIFGVFIMILPGVYIGIGIKKLVEKWFPNRNIITEYLDQTYYESQDGFFKDICKLMESEYLFSYMDTSGERVYFDNIGKFSKLDYYNILEMFRNINDSLSFRGCDKLTQNIDQEMECLSHVYDKYISAREYSIDNGLTRFKLESMSGIKLSDKFSIMLSPKFSEYNSRYIKHMVYNLEAYEGAFNSMDVIHRYAKAYNYVIDKVSTLIDQDGYWDISKEKEVYKDPIIRDIMMIYGAGDLATLAHHSYDRYVYLIKSLNGIYYGMYLYDIALAMAEKIPISKYTDDQILAVFYRMVTKISHVEYELGCEGYFKDYPPKPSLYSRNKREIDHNIVHTIKLRNLKHYLRNNN